MGLGQGCTWSAVHEVVCRRSCCNPGNHLPASYCHQLAVGCELLSNSSSNSRLGASKLLARRLPLRVPSAPNPLANVLSLLRPTNSLAPPPSPPPAMHRNAAATWASSNVRINCVAAGLMESPSSAEVSQVEETTKASAEVRVMMTNLPDQ